MYEIIIENQYVVGIMRSVPVFSIVNKTVKKLFCLFIFFLLPPVLADERTNSAFESVLDVIPEMHRHLVLDSYPDWAPDLNWTALRTFYAKRDFLPIWQTYTGPTDRAKSLRDVLLQADTEGLDPAEYHAPAIRYLWRAKKLHSKARFELLMTDAFLRYSQEVSAGYPHPKAVDVDWNVRPRKIRNSVRLESILMVKDVKTLLASFAPRHSGYQKLREKLAYYRTLAKDGAWQSIPYTRQLQIGMRDVNVPLLKKRLIREQYLDVDENPESFLFDEVLDVAVRKFQQNYGHKVDGVVGNYTRQGMNKTIQQLIVKIKQNMERWRWMPAELGAGYIMVNMAGYELDLVRNGKSVLNMPVIIGKPFRATPAFIDKLEYIEANPTWKVPPRIAKERFLPILKEDPTFLSDNHLLVYDSWRKDAKEVDPAKIDWQTISDKRFPFRLEQTPGNYNSMGRIKFMFPNRFRVYLHDTPDRSLFNRHVRTFSSGCIRLAKPFELANSILSWQKNDVPTDIRHIINSGKTTRIELKQKLPVYLMYWTAWVDEQGKINFRNDVYQRNEMIATGVLSKVS